MPLSASVSASTLVRLERAARLAARHSYSPYSRFPVGAAVLASSGKIYRGTNVENASYGLGQCAERAAICAAVAAGERRLRCVVIYTPTTAATAPCGACRQAINEFGPRAQVISTCDSDDRLDVTLDALLPGAFGPADLGR
jgi:cytidine deaminase